MGFISALAPASLRISATASSRPLSNSFALKAVVNEVSRSRPRLAREYLAGRIARLELDVMLFLGDQDVEPVHLEFLGVIGGGLVAVLPSSESTVSTTTCQRV